MIFLALIPAIALMIFVYLMDRKEKESPKVLWTCFLLGVVSTIPAVAFELVVDLFESFVMTRGSFLYAFFDSICVVALAEEGCKYLMLRLRTWNHRGFNCMYDGIVYAVFVSMGFAAFENVIYVINGDVSTALLRMFTAVPSHAVDAVFMGVFYSHAKQAALNGDRSKRITNTILALLVPIATHGIYDSLISLEEEIVGDLIVSLAYLAWIGVVVLSFTAAFVVIFVTSKKDHFFYVKNITGATYIPVPQPAPTAMPVQQPVPAQATVPISLRPGNWICRCGAINGNNFCPRCGTAIENAAWK